MGFLEYFNHIIRDKELCPDEFQRQCLFDYVGSNIILGNNYLIDFGYEVINSPYKNIFELLREFERADLKPTIWKSIQHAHKNRPFLLTDEIKKQGIRGIRKLNEKP